MTHNILLHTFAKDCVAFISNSDHRLVYLNALSVYLANALNLDAVNGSQTQPQNKRLLVLFPGRAGYTVNKLRVARGLNHVGEDV